MALFSPKVAFTVVLHWLRAETVFALLLGAAYFGTTIINVILMLKTAALALSRLFTKTVKFVTKYQDTISIIEHTTFTR
jgi:hypothetical protein